MLRWRSEGCLKTSRNELDCLEKREGRLDEVGRRLRDQNSIQVVNLLRRPGERSRGGKVETRALSSPIRSAVRGCKRTNRRVRKRVREQLVLRFMSVTARDSRCVGFAGSFVSGLPLSVNRNKTGHAWTWSTH